MANKNDALKKHHFWILAGLAPLLVLLAIVFLMTGVSGAIDSANAEVTKVEGEVKGANAPGTGTLAELEKKKATLGDVRGQLWKLNWDKQAGFFKWPDTPNNTFERYNTMKFGTSFRDFISNTRLYDDFKPAYLNAYQKLGESIAPTAFKGGSWQGVLRWVNDWGNRSPESRQLWLAMEDLWIQRAMLKPIAQVNDDLTRFTLVQPNGQKPPPKKRKFVSHVWELDLEVAPRKPNQGPGQMLKAKLKNRTPQLQVLGVGSAMQLKVWLDSRLDLPPFECRIEGAGVPGGEMIPAADPAKRAAGEEESIEIFLPPGQDVTEIAQVQQVLDRRTVPIRRLDRLALGYLSAKDFSKPMLAPPFFPEAAVDPAAQGNGPPGMPAPGVPGNEFGSGGGPPPGLGGGVGGAGATAAVPGRAGPMRLLDVADLNKKRYLEINDQLRRVPVALTVVVDQMYMNDVLIAFANSPLRFEAVQYHWQRFTDTLAPAGGGTGYGGSPDPLSGGMGDGESAMATGFTGSGLSSSGYGPPPGFGPGTGDVRSGLGFGGMSGPGGFGGIPGLGSETLSGVSEAQANAGLIELTIYGIVTLYERYEPVKKEGDAAAVPPAEAPKADDAKPAAPATPAVPGAVPPAPTPMNATPTTPAPMPPMPTTPAPMSPMPMTPAPMTTPPPMSPK